MIGSLGNSPGRDSSSKHRDNLSFLSFKLDKKEAPSAGGRGVILVVSKE